MKVSKFQLLDVNAEQQIRALVEGFNQTTTDYPRDRTVHSLFTERALAHPEAVAVLFDGKTLTYGELEKAANKVARFLLEQGVKPEEFVALMLERSLEMIVATLGILKAGAAYVPLSHDQPFDRLRHLVQDTSARVLISERQYMRTLNRLQWECRPGLDAILCVDTANVAGVIEDSAGIMDLAIWDYVADEAFDDISGGGWKSSYTGEWLSREVMDEYGENIRLKLAPLLGPESRVFEVGCASGISMFRIAPTVARYYGTDLSKGIVRWARKEASARGLTNVHVESLPAHQIDQAGEHGFDVIVLNSVIECFPGHNYLADVLRKAMALLKDQGWLFLGNLWDQDLKDAFVQSLVEFKRTHAGEHHRTKTDRNDELFISRAFLEDLRHDCPAVASIEYSTMLGSAESELSQFGFDALIRIDKTRTHEPAAPRRRRQYDRRAIDAQSDAAVDECTTSNSLAYLMYTSGTSGQPKGVMIEHHSVLRLVINTNYVHLAPSDRVLQTGALGFDASTFEIWGPLLHGGAVCLPKGRSFLDPAEFGRLIQANHVTTLFLTTGLFNQLVETDIGVFEGLKTLLTGGEKVSVQHVNKIRRTYPMLAVKHVYGPTESTTFATCQDVVRDYERDIPIGRPIANTTAYVLDQSQRPVGVGVSGELCIGGDGLARGYLNDVDLTRRKFIPHVFDPNARLYRTGDLVRWLPDGAIEFIGRIDTQIKIRGYRIELEEIESVLLQHELVTQAAVLARDRGDGPQLVGYVSGRDLAIDDLKQHVAARLPAYMVPTRFMLLDRMPMNASGKIDRKALPDPDLSEAGASCLEAPETDLESRLVSIWERVLGVRNIGVESDFFDLGGHSLKVTKLVSLVQSEIGVEVPITVVFRTPTIRELARYITDRSSLDPRIVDDELVPLNRHAAGRPVFAFPPGSGYCLAYTKLADLVPRPFYGLSFIEHDDRLPRYVDLLTSVDPTGPYVLIGYSAGGKLAFQVASALERAGKAVSRIVLLDAARYLRRVRFGDEEMREVAKDFLDGISSRVLRERATQRIQRYRSFIGDCVETGTINADIHLILASDSRDYVGDDGQTVATLQGWKDLTRGRFDVRQGDGAHRELLTSPHLEVNAMLLNEILDRP